MRVAKLQVYKDRPEIVVPLPPRWLVFALKSYDIEINPLTYSLDSNRFEYSIKSLKPESYGQITSSQIKSVGSLLSRRGFKNSIGNYFGPAIIRLTNGWEVRIATNTMSTGKVLAPFGYMGENYKSRLSGKKELIS